MAIFVIPTSTTNPSYTQTVQLSGVRYTLSLRYNTRLGRWILDVADASGASIVNGIAMLTNRDLTGQYTTLSVPPGVLFCLNTQDPAAQPTLSSFLLDTAFAYLDPAA